MNVELSFVFRAADKAVMTVEYRFKQSFVSSFADTQQRQEHPRLFGMKTDDFHAE